MTDRRSNNRLSPDRRATKLVAVQGSVQGSVPSERSEFRNATGCGVSGVESLDGSCCPGRDGRFASLWSLASLLAVLLVPPAVGRGQESERQRATDESIAAEAAPPESATSEEKTPDVGRKEVHVERNVVYVERPDVKLLADLYYPATTTTPADQQASAQNPTTSGADAAGAASSSEAKPSGKGENEPSLARHQAVGGQRVPGVLMVHGGAWMSGSKMQVAWHAMRLAQRGYFVMAINYRLAPKYQHPAQIDDCRDALQWLHAHADQLGVDRQRLGAYGYSAGGHLVCLLGLSAAHDPKSIGNGPKNQSALATEDGVAFAEKPLKEQVTVQCVVAGGAPCDFGRMPLDSSQLSFWLGGTRRELPEVYRLASPITYASSKSPPLFLFHGESDHLVPGTGAERLRQSLQEQGVTCQWHPVPKAGHLQAYLDADAFEEAVRFFDRWLAARGE